MYNVNRVGNAFAFDSVTVDALKACHEYVWFEVPTFKDLWNAAVSVYPLSADGSQRTVNWNVNWDSLVIRAVATCSTVDVKKSDA